MDRVIKKHFTGYLHKFNPKDIRGKEVLFFAILALNLLAFLLNIVTGDLFFLMNLVGMGLMVNVLNTYYRTER